MKLSPWAIALARDAKRGRILINRYAVFPTTACVRRTAGTQDLVARSAEQATITPRPAGHDNNIMQPPSSLLLEEAAIKLPLF
jgi:hypothetical protein